MSHLKLATHKVGEINKNKRIFLSNKDLLKSFDIGDAVNISYSDKNEEIVVEKVELLGNHSISGRNGVTGVLDIKNKSVEKALPGVEMIEIKYYKNKLVIRATKNDILRRERSSKKQKTMFEIFSGAGTLSHFFKEKYRSVGALDFDNGSLGLFEENEHEQILTIHSAIEDIHPSDYPKGISLLLAGVPCTDFTPANLAMNKAQKRFTEGKANEDDMVRIESKYTSEALTYHLLLAINEMNPRTIVVENVLAFSKSSASQLLRTILRQKNYILSEAVSSGKNTKRRRWTLVANMDNKVNLEELDVPNGLTIEDHLETPVANREWLKISESKRFSGAQRKKSVGLRYCLPSDTKVNTFTTNGNRSSEPALRHPTEELYSEFSNREIANIHGLKGFKLTGKKTCDRKYLGQGVNDMFAEVCNRIELANSSQ